MCSLTIPLFVMPDVIASDQDSSTLSSDHFYCQEIYKLTKSSCRREKHRRVKEMVLRSRNCWWLFVPLLISFGIGGTSFVIEAPNSATAILAYRSIGVPSQTSLHLSSYDSEYYTPAEQLAQSGQSPITLSRFLSQYVKDHPEVSATDLQCMSAFSMYCQMSF
jgi:hypothetical protein